MITTIDDNLHSKPSVGQNSSQKLSEHIVYFIFDKCLPLQILNL